jgi:hypothetical protein
MVDLRGIARIEEIAKMMVVKRGKVIKEKGRKQKNGRDLI